MTLNGVFAVVSDIKESSYSVCGIKPVITIDDETNQFGSCCCTVDVASELEIGN